MFEEYWRLASTARLNESWCVMTERATLVLKNDVAELEKVMALVSDVCKRHSIPPETEYDLTLALDEVVTNVARHAYPQGETHQFTLKVTVSGTEFEARVETMVWPSIPPHIRRRILISLWRSAKRVVWVFSWFVKS